MARKLFIHSDAAKKSWYIGTDAHDVPRKQPINGQLQRTVPLTRRVYRKLWTGSEWGNSLRSLALKFDTKADAEAYLEENRAKLVA